MQKGFFVLLFFLPVICFSQKDSVVVLNKTETKAIPQDESATKIFYSQKLINSNTVEVLPKGIMEFRISHGFGDIAGDAGGIKSLYGLDLATDVRIGFQTGLTNRLNLITARAKGGLGNPSKLWELGLKYQVLQQMEGDPKRPVSVSIFANIVTSSMASTYDQEHQLDSTGNLVRMDHTESNINKFSDRLSEVIQVMVAKKFGKISLQLTPTYVYRSLVNTNYKNENIDDKGIFALGGGARIPLTKKFFLILDYFHVFRSKASTDSLKSFPTSGTSSFRPKHFYDPLGVGFEILTAGHVFHLNFTNATQLLENRFIPNTVTSWGKGQFRWAFTISRNFTLFRDKKNK